MSPNARTLYARTMLVGVAALLPTVLLRPFFVEIPVVPFLGALCLLAVPGMVLAVWLCGEDLSGAAMAPVAFVLGLGVFSLLGVPFLLLGLGLRAYLLSSGAVVAASLLACAFGALRGGKRGPGEIRAPSSSGWLWAPFLLLGAALAVASGTRSPFPYDDVWVYMAWVNEFLGGGALREPYFGGEVGTSRAMINGWLFGQAALARISGTETVELVLRYLTPALAVMSLLAFYALARALFRDGTAALLAASLHAVGVLAGFGGRWIFRVSEDKFAAWFLFLPAGLVFAVLFLENRKKRYLVALAFICWAVVAVHPVGLALLGLSVAGLGVAHLAAGWREKEAWIGASGLAGALLSVLLAPVVYLLATGESLVAMLRSADISSGDPDVLANMVFVKPGWDRVLEIGGGLYMVHPAQLLNPVVLAALVVGPFFLLRQLRKSVPAQLLLGTLLVPLVVCFVPPIATLFGDHLVLPGQMWRLAWPIPLAASLTVGWMIWELARLARVGLSAPRRGRFLPLALVCALAVAAAPAYAGQAEAVYRALEGDRSPDLCFDPVFPWIGENLREESVVLAPDLENTCIPAYSSRANVVSLRGNLVLRVLPQLEERAPGRIEVSQGTLDVRRFFYRSTPEEKVGLIETLDADYVLARADSPADEALENLPGLRLVHAPGQHRLYAANDPAPNGGRPGPRAATSPPFNKDLSRVFPLFNQGAGDKF